MVETGKHMVLPVHWMSSLVFCCLLDVESPFNKVQEHHSTRYSKAHTHTHTLMHA